MGDIYFLGEYQIYFIKCVEKSDIFNSRDEINLVFTEKKVNGLFILHMQ